MSEIKNLFQRINEVRKSIDYIQKDKQVSTGQSGSYKAVSHDQVTALVRQHMIDHGIVSFPYLVSSTMNPPLVNVDGSQEKQKRYEATYDITFANIDAPEDKIVIRIEAHALDNGDKAPGKALSYAKKYAILKLFEIETGEDEESRYQEKETFNLEFHSELIRGAKDSAELKSLYDDAKKQAMALNAVAEFKALSALTAQMNDKFKGAGNA